MRLEREIFVGHFKRLCLIALFYNLKGTEEPLLKVLHMSRLVFSKVCWALTEEWLVGRGSESNGRLEVLRVQEDNDREVVKMGKINGFRRRLKLKIGKTP